MEPKKCGKKGVIIIPLLYLLVCSLWIYLSDYFVGLFFSDPQKLILIQTIKGLVFVLGTSALLYGLIRYYFTRIYAGIDTIMEREAQYRILFERSLDAIFLVDRITGRYLDANLAAQNLTGRSLQDLKTLKTRDVSPVGAEDRLSRIAVSEEALELGEVTYLRPDGTTRIALLSMVPFNRDVICGIARDITDHKQAEKELWESQAILQAAMNQSQAGIAIADAPSGKLRYVNDAGLLIRGKSKEESINGVGIDQYVASWQILHFDGTPYQRDEVPLARAILYGETSSKEFIIRRPNNEDRIVWANAAPIKNDLGEITAGIVVFLDITDRKQMEEARSKMEDQLRQTLKMESIGQLAGGIAHDFNNILMAIKGYTEFVIQKIPNSDPMYDDLMEVQKAADRAASLTRQLLAFSRKQVLQPIVLDLNDLILNTDKMLRRLIGENIEYVTIPSSDLWRVKVDPGQLEQVLVNLAVNARDAMPAGGQLTIETKNVEIDEEYAHNHLDAHPGSYVMLSVSDSGCGMDKEIQAKVFEPFFTTKEKGKGTGLGLSTVHGIVKQSGGHIFVYSEMNQGTTFKIYLPRIDDERSSLLRELTPVVSLRGTETILLVEDENVVRTIVRRALQEHGYTVLEARYGSEVFTINQQHSGKIQLLLTDVILPKMSGKEIAYRLSTLRPDMKILYMSGYTDNAIVHHGMLDEGVNFLQKPFRSEDLLIKVREILDRE